MTSTDDSRRVRPRTKKEAIIELLQPTNPPYSYKEIAEKVGSTPGNVGQVKSEWEKQNKLANSSIPAQVSAKTPSLAPQKEQASPRFRQMPSHSSHTMTSELRQRVWRMFDKEMTPIEVIKLTGLDPDMIEIEYSKYLKLKKTPNIAEIQRELVVKLGRSWKK